MERGTKTFICSVVFLDIAEYSKKPVTEQIRLKERFNALLSQALQDVAVNDRIILDTGDGAAISFLGDPEDALFVAMSLRDSVSANATAETVPLQLRIGVNLGPVRLVTDINGQPNIIGDGINVAQRVMSFAQMNQVLVSRSYFEVVSRLSEEYDQLFHYEGSRTDKHVREHEVYALGHPSVPRPRPAAPAGVSETGLSTGSKSTGALTLPKWKSRKLWIALALAVALALPLGLVIRGMKAESPRSAEPIASAEPEAPKPERAQPEQEKPALPPRQASPPAPEQAEALPARAQEAMRAGKLARAEGAAGLLPRQTALVALAITPWGEVYVDGKLQGVSPPLRFVQVTPGSHRIEIRNSSFPPYRETVVVQAAGKVRVKHRF